jgi:peroxiredoxin
VVLLQFLYTTCQHCQATSRTFTKIQNELGPRGLQVLGVAFNEEALSNADALRAYANANGVTFPICIASREAVLNYLGISFMSRFVVPQIVLIDRQGVIRAQSDALGSQELMDEAGLRPLLERLIAEPARAAKSAKRQPLRSDLRNR